MKNSDSITTESAVNERHVADMNFAMKHTKWFLRLYGIWPLVATNSSVFEKYLAKGLVIACPVSMLLMLGPIFTYIAVKNPKIQEITILVPPIVAGFANCSKHLILTLKVDSVRICYVHMATDWKMLENERDRQIMIETLGMVHTVTFWAYSGMFIITPLYWLVGPLYTPQTMVNEFNETVKALSNPGSNLLGETPVNIKYEIILCTNFYSGLVNMTVASGMWNLSAIFVAHACGQISIILSKLEDVIGPKDDSKFENNPELVDRVRTVIRYHVRLLDFSKGIESILQYICLMEVFTETMIISFLGYNSVMGWKSNDFIAVSTYAPVLLLYAFNLFVFCEIGEHLKEKSEEVGNAAYLIEWYRLPTKLQLALIMVMMKSSTPQKLTAAGIMEMSRISYTQVMKTAFAYLNMLRTV